MQLTEGEIARATFWVRRWKMVGGIFVVTDDGVAAERQEHADPAVEQAQARAAQALLEELGKDHKKRAHVISLITHALDQREARQDNDPPEAA
jgi:hypothetical protein